MHKGQQVQLDAIKRDRVAAYALLRTVMMMMM